MYSSPHRNRKYHANLLLLKNKDKDHYVVIKSLSRLLSGRTAHDGRMHVCKSCLYSFTKKESCTAHEEVCSKIRLKSSHNRMNAISIWNSKISEMVIPLFSQFIVTSKCLVVPVQDDKERKINRHIPCSVGCLTVSDCQEYNEKHIWIHSGSNTMAKFFEPLDKGVRTNKCNLEWFKTDGSTDSRMKTTLPAHQQLW